MARARARARGPARAPPLSHSPAELCPAQDAPFTGKRKRSLAGRAKKLQRSINRGYYVPRSNDDFIRGQLRDATAAAAAAKAEAKRAEDRRRWAAEESAASFSACLAAERDRDDAEAVALRACDGLTRAIDQRDELYYQALHANSLAAHTLQACHAFRLLPGSKAQLKQRKAAVVAQSTSLRSAVRPHLRAQAGHRPIPRPQALVGQLPSRKGGGA